MPPLGPIDSNPCCCPTMPGTYLPIAPYVVSLNGLSGLLVIDGQGAIDVSAVGGTIFLSLSASAGLGTVTSVGLISSASSAISISGSPITTAGSITLTIDPTLVAFAAAPVAANTIVYGSGVDTFSVGAFPAVGRTLVAQTTQALARTIGLGASSVGSNIFTIPNPGGVRFIRINADDSVTSLTAVQTVTALSLTIGTNTQAWSADLDAFVTNASWGGSALILAGSLEAAGYVQSNEKLIVNGVATAGNPLLQLYEDGNLLLEILDNGKALWNVNGGATGDLFDFQYGGGSLFVIRDNDTAEFAGNLTANSYTGEGSGLSSLNADQITSGTIGTSRMSGSYTGITGTGALSAGSLASGFTVVTGALGGTGVANTGKTITLGGNLTTSGAFATTLTVTAVTAVQLPTSGTLYGTQSGSITSAQLAASLTDETGSGANVFATSPALLAAALTSPTFDKTITAAGTTGAQTINKVSGSVNFAAAATTLVVTNSLVSATSRVFCFINTDDLTAVLKNVVCTSGSFTIKMGTAPTSECAVAFFVLN